MTPTQLYKAKEETEEFGGYFIVNGIEKIIRMLIVPRRNYPMAIKHTVAALWSWMHQRRHSRLRGEVAFFVG